MTEPDWSSDCGTVKLWNADCRDILPELGGVDAIVSDPPYGIGYVHSGGLRGVKAAVGITKAANARGCKPIAGDKAPFDPTPLLDFPRVLIFGADHYRDKLPAGGTFIAWDKAVGRGPDDDFCDAEFAWCNWKQKRNVFRQLWKGLACEKAGEGNGLRLHPTQKPLRLMSWCVSIAAPENAVVCDPFMGSGSTGVAAVRLNRRFYGMEIDEEHFDNAVMRIQKELNRMPLFTEPPLIQQSILTEPTDA